MLKLIKLHFHFHISIPCSMAFPFLRFIESLHFGVFPPLLATSTLFYSTSNPKKGALFQIKRNMLFVCYSHELATIWQCKLNNRRKKKKSNKHFSPLIRIVVSKCKLLYRGIQIGCYYRLMCKKWILIVCVFCCIIFHRFYSFFISIQIHVNQLFTSAGNRAQNFIGYFIAFAITQQQKMELKKMLPFQL